MVVRYADANSTLRFRSNREIVSLQRLRKPYQDVTPLNLWFVVEF